MTVTDCVEMGIEEAAAKALEVAWDGVDAVWLSFDVDWMRGQSVGIFPVQYSSPEPIIAELEKILDAGDGGLSQGNIKFQIMARMNGILVVTKKPDLLRAAETWIKRLDTSDTNRTTSHSWDGYDIACTPMPHALYLAFEIGRPLGVGEFFWKFISTRSVACQATCSSRLSSTLYLNTGRTCNRRSPL